MARLICSSVNPTAMHTHHYIVLFLFLMHHVSAEEPPLEMARYRDQEMHLLIKGKRNYTGHLVTEVHFSEETAKIGDDWKLELKHGVSESGGKKKFHLRGTITVPPKLPEGYHLFPGIGYYKFHWNASTTFLEALSKCRDEGGHLIIINSEEEAGVVRILFSSYNPEKLTAFAGFFDPAMGQNFVTIFGQPLNETGYQKWGKGQPNGRENESCGYVYADGTIGDVVCNSLFPFMCEYDLSWSAD